MSLYKSNGIRGWFNGSRGVYDQTRDASYVSCITSGGLTRIDGYRHATGIQRSYSLATLAADDHSNPDLLLLHPDGPHGGNLLAAYAEHPGSLYTRRTMAAGGNGAWTKAAAAVSSNASYAVLAQVTDTAYTVYVFYRDETANPTRPRSFRTSTDGGATWSSATQFWTGGASKTPYLQACHSGNRVDFLVTNDAGNAANASIYHFYFTVAADGTRSWFKSDGTQIGTGDSALPLTTADVTRVHDGTGTPGSWVWDIDWVGGTLTAAYATFATTSSTADTHTYKIAKLSGGSWTAETVADGGSHLPNWIYPDADTGEPGYSGGICLDPNDADAVYVSRKYGSGDSRVEKWTKSGTWSKSVDVSGNTSSINARPVAVRGRSPTQVFYWRGTYTSYTSYSTDIHAYPDLTINSSFTPQLKPASPAWQAGNAPAGCNGYWPLTDGSGTTVTDLKPSGKNGSFVGSPAWGTGSYGPELGSFSTTAYVAIDPAAQLVADGSYPFWTAVMFTGNSSTADQVPFSAGRSSSANPSVSLRINDGSAQRVSCFTRNDANTDLSPAATGQACNDGNPHVLMMVWWTSAGDRRLYFDGNEVNIPATESALGTTTLNQLTIGALRRNTVSLPFAGGSIIAAATGSGNAPDPFDLAHDWLSGEFSAIRVADAVAPTLTSATRTVTGETTATVGVTTDEDNGTLYVVVTTSATQPSAAQIKAGQNHTGAAASFADDQAIASTGAKTFNATGLQAGTAYVAHFMHEDAAANQSTVVSTTNFTTFSPPTRPTISATGILATSATLNGTAFVDTDGNTHTHSQWQVTTDADTGFASPVISTGDDGTNLTSYAATGLATGTIYRARVRYKDSGGSYSAWSTAITFTPLSGGFGVRRLSRPGSLPRLRRLLRP